jgi:hypothetical protein
MCTKVKSYTHTGKSLHLVKDHPRAMFGLGYSSDNCVDFFPLLSGVPCEVNDTSLYVMAFKIPRLLTNLYCYIVKVPVHPVYSKGASLKKLLMKNG